MVYDWQKIEEDIPKLQTRAGGANTELYRALADLEQQASKFDEMTAQHAKGLTGIAGDLAVKRCSDMVTGVKTSGDDLGATIAKLRSRLELQDKECFTILSNMQSMVTRG